MQSLKLLLVRIIIYIYVQVKRCKSRKYHSKTIDFLYYTTQIVNFTYTWKLFSVKCSLITTSMMLYIGPYLINHKLLKCV